MKPTIYLLLILMTLPIFARDTFDRKSPYKEKLDSARIDERTKVIFTYDEHGNNTSMTFFYYMNSEWTANSKYHYTYDTKNRLASEWSMSYEGGVWVGQTDKVHYTYDSENRIATDTTYSWDDEKSDWVKSHYSEFTYTSFDSLHLELMYRYDEPEQEWKRNYKVEYSYNSRRDITLKLTLHPNMDEWEERAKIEYMYDANGNGIERLESYNSLNTWTPMYRYSYGYNSNNENTTFEKTEFWDGEWLERQKAEMTYHSSGKVATTIIHNKQGGEWVAASKRDDNYDEQGNHTSVVLHKYSTDWTPYYRYDYAYDLTTSVSEVFCPNMDTYTHKVLSESVSSWSVETNEWSVNSVNNFFYSDLITPVLQQNATITESDVELYLIGNQLNLQTNISGKAEVTIFTLQGREIYSAPLQQKLLLDLSPFAEGVYTGLITSPQGMRSFRFVK